MEAKMVDHLFRHQYGKMVAVYTRVFGLAHLETIEDAVQDTFVKATLQWRQTFPDNPEAWLMRAARNRIIDLLRKIKSDQDRERRMISGPAALEIREIFLDHEVEDSQLRMIFVACHPVLSREEQIAFALRTISGFSMKEVATALLMKDDTIKKRLQRARKTMVAREVKLVYPEPAEVPTRMAAVMQVIYLIFNEGFHSTKAEQLINRDLCGEAIRLAQLLLKKEQFRSGALYALFALMCFHAARLESKIGPQGEIVDLAHQDRTRWYMPLILLGNDALARSADYPDWSAYHYEAAIAGQHVRAIRFADTDWAQILKLYQKMNAQYPGDPGRLNLAMVHLQLEQFTEAKAALDAIDASGLGRRAYLLHGGYAEYHFQRGDVGAARSALETAIALATNELERAYLRQKMARISGT